MPRVCTVCSHPERQAIDAALIQSTPNRRIASQHTLNEAAIRRHAASHLPAALSLASAAANVAHADDLIAQVHKLAADAQRIATAAEASKDFRTALAGVRELTRIVELLAKLRGDINEGSTVNVVNVTPANLDSLREQLAAKLANAAAPQQPIIMPALAPSPLDERAPLVIDVEPAK